MLIEVVIETKITTKFVDIVKLLSEAFDGYDLKLLRVSLLKEEANRNE